MLLLLFHLFLLQLDGIRDTTNSLNKIIIGIHAGNLFISTNNIIAASTNILSAIGSRNWINFAVTVMMTICVIATIFSGYDYIKNGKDLFKEN